MPMKRQAALLALLLPAIPGCSFKTEWRDTTGAGRSQDVAQAEARTCSDASGLGTLDHTSHRPLLAFKEKMDACMDARGWKLVRASA